MAEIIRHEGTPFIDNDPAENRIDLHRAGENLMSMSELERARRSGKAAGVAGIQEEIDTLLAEPTPEKTIDLMTWATINNRENKIREYQSRQKAA